MLAALTHPGHIVIYAPGDSFPCRRAATRNLLGINPLINFLIFLKNIIVGLKTHIEVVFTIYHYKKSG
ncbi:conserved hypothetical protein [Photorhabdus asymbiotica]|uniref:Uncharacterized protein n=1 Tax=Photorhabdus asymbiotica subsp. asymbiotica (strain ATCC 43949 / 3105-77) TaxID=553480 RepID=C7BMW9_PHOAA|nr:conserved hypothetical protein [Photorhabdus asymbiotica]